MTTVIRTLLEDDREGHNILHEICMGIYLDGECYAFAIALHRGLGWPIIGLINGDIIRHTAVQSPDGILHDARGVISKNEFAAPFDIVPPHNLVEVSEEKLLRDGETNEIREASIQMARKIAEAIWPKLPWKESLASKVSAFADELEILCKKHRIWIRASFPATAPILAPSMDDEGGYILKPTADGLSFTIGRYFR